MATEDILRKRIDKMLAQIGPQLPVDEKPYTKPQLLTLYGRGVTGGDVEYFIKIDKPHLLTDQELKRLEAYVEQVQPKLRGINDYRASIREFTRLELNETILWCKLGEAIEQEDIEAAATCRYVLNGGPDQILHWRDIFAAQAV